MTRIALFGALESRDRFWHNVIYEKVWHFAIVLCFTSNTDCIWLQLFLQILLFWIRFDPKPNHNSHCLTTSSVPVITHIEKQLIQCLLWLTQKSTQNRNNKQKPFPLLSMNQFECQNRKTFTSIALVVNSDPIWLNRSGGQRPSHAVGQSGRPMEWQ